MQSPQGICGRNPDVSVGSTSQNAIRAPIEKESAVAVHVEQLIRAVLVLEGEYAGIKASTIGITGLDQHAGTTAGRVKDVKPRIGQGAIDSDGAVGPDRKTCLRRIAFVKDRKIPAPAGRQAIGPSGCILKIQRRVLGRNMKMRYGVCRPDADGSGRGEDVRLCASARSQTQAQQRRDFDSVIHESRRRWKNPRFTLLSQNARARRQSLPGQDTEPRPSPLKLNAEKGQVW